MTRQDDDRTAETALNVARGIASSHDGLHRSKRRVFKRTNRPADIHDLAGKIAAGDRLSLAKGITLVESMAERDRPAGQALLQELLPDSGNSVRIGITGVPGAGKSTFIEAFGRMLTESGHRVAVLAVDPSSTVTGGSILGDKTRMELLAREPNAFIRPSPSAGTLGGVHRKTRETMLLCEAAGYDVILVETVGVGQSETAVRDMTDFFLMLALTGAGDELQGMKKGIMELADGIIVHKADGSNERLAKKTVREYRQLAHFLQPATPGWTTQALPVSSLALTGLTETWTMIGEFKRTTEASGYWRQRRQEQTKSWFHSMIRDRLIDSFYGRPGRKEQVASLEARLLADGLTVSQAVSQLFDVHDEGQADGCESS